MMMGGREQGEDGEGGNMGREGGIDDVGRVGARVEEGGLRKGTSEEGTEQGMDGARERGEGGSEQRREGATERGRGTGRSWERKGDREGGKLQRMYPDEHTEQYTVNIAALTLKVLLSPHS